MALPDPILKPWQVAKAIGVSVSTIKRWVDADALMASRTVGRHRLIPLSEAVRFARQQGLPQLGLEALAAPGSSPIGKIHGRLLDVLTDVLRRGDARRARAIIESTFASCGGAVPLADRLLSPVMERIGHGWSVGAVDVYQEHQASQIVASVLVELNERLARGLHGPAPLALGCTTEGDPYVLSLLLGELSLRELGWEVRNLGLNLPLRSLAGAVLEYRPRLVFLSVNYLADGERFARDYQAFHESTATTGVAVVVGGHALVPDLRARLVDSSFGEQIMHLSEFARRLGPSTGAGVVGN